MTTAVPHAENSGVAWSAAPKTGETEALPLRFLPSAAAGSAPGRPAGSRGEKGGMLREVAPPGWSKAVEIGDFGGGWLVHPRRVLGAQRAQSFALGGVVPPRATRCVLRRHKSRARALSRVCV